MSGLELTLAQSLDFELDLSDVLPERLLGLSVEDVKKTKIAYGQRRVALGELFEIIAKTESDLTIKGATTRLRRIGSNMSEGLLHVDGDTGDEVGLDMRGGRITVSGNSGDFAGAGMLGGFLEIIGNAGDFVGGAYPSAMTGMRGGLISIRGNAGARLGDRQRRGIVIVHGDVGDGAASNMIAGTVVVFGNTGRQIGQGMRRGTIILWREPERFAANFNDCGHYKLALTTLLSRHLLDIDRRASRQLGKLDRVRRFVGDRGANGQGEILIAATE